MIIPEWTRLTRQARCGNFLDPLIEHPPLLLVLDLILLKSRVYLHLLFNRGHPPNDGRSDDASPRASVESNSPRDLLSDWTYLATATIITESATRWLAARQTSTTPTTADIRLLVLTVIAELAAQHATTTVVALLALRLRGWTQATQKHQLDGRQKHFE